MLQIYAYVHLRTFLMLQINFLMTSFGYIIPLVSFYSIAFIANLRKP